MIENNKPLSNEWFVVFTYEAFNKIKPKILDAVEAHVDGELKGAGLCVPVTESPASTLQMRQNIRF